MQYKSPPHKWRLGSSSGTDVGGTRGAVHRVGSMFEGGGGALWNALRECAQRPFHFTKAKKKRQLPQSAVFCVRFLGQPAQLSL